jgi:cytochrome c oxidase assembly protein subunit 15
LNPAQYSSGRLKCFVISHIMKSKQLSRFILAAQISLVLVFLVIIAGSVVRATGSGMGCPDWPKCFGKWIPPTSADELPDNYKQLYAGEHNAVEEFNALNTWTEYGNRLVGALLGIAAFIQLVLSFGLRRTDKRLLRLSLIQCLMIGFQGWLGAKVVSSNLAPVKITIHMVFALLILAVAISIVQRAKKLGGTPEEAIRDEGLKKSGTLVLLLSIVQILLGTQVREVVDLRLDNFDPQLRGDIVDSVGATFLVHRSFSILLLALNGWWIYKILKGGLSSLMKKYCVWLSVVLCLEVIAGIVLSRFALPAPVQPLHLLLACIMFALQYAMMLRLLKAPGH